LVFICPSCGEKALEITSSIELPPDSRSDEITLQILECTNCEFKSLGLYEESRRGALGSEPINHMSIYLPKDVLEGIESMIKKCPDPKNPRCSCTSHRCFSVKSNGRWKWIEKLNYKKSFRLITKNQ